MRACVRTAVFPTALLSTSSCILCVSCYDVMERGVMAFLGNPFFRQNAGTVGTDVKQDWVDQLFWIRLFLVGSLWNSELFARKKLL